MEARNLPVDTRIQYVSVSKTLIRIVTDMLRKSIKDSELAVCEIMEKIQSLTNVSENQKKLLESAVEGYYQDADGDELKSTLTTAADAIFEAATEGNFEKIDEIAKSETYTKARKATKKLHDQLQVVSQDTTLDSTLMPVMMALQFHDKMRQELESIILCFDHYRGYVDKIAPGNGTTEPHAEFWKKIATLFTNVEAREIVKKHTTFITK